MVRRVPQEELKMKTKKAKAVKKAKKAAKPKQAQVRSKAARAHIAEGTRLFALAGRPTKAQFVKVYGPKGPKMTWAQRAKAGIDAKHFQEALKAKS
jgi:cytochrome c5